jgi:hypothetical protein
LLRFLSPPFRLVSSRNRPAETDPMPLPLPLPLHALP